MLKIAIIGARGYQRHDEEVCIKCFSWNKLNKIENLRDYDTVILNLLSLKDRENIDWTEFCNHLNYSSMNDIIAHDGGIIILGDPRFTIRRKHPSKKKEIEEPFLAWTGIQFKWDNKSGDTVDFDDDYSHKAYWEYIPKLKKWDYSLRNCDHDPSISLTNLHEQGKDLLLVKDFFCKNRYDGALAFSISFKFVDNRRDEVLLWTGPLIFLPKINLSEDETLQLILKDICGVETSAPEPEWIEKIEAPGQKEIDVEIRVVESEIQSLGERLNGAKERRNEVRSCLKLLYDRGLSLEEAVRDVFRKLGAEVEDPENPGKEDGWITVQVGDKTFEWVLEVKGTRNNEFDEVGRRQLSEWIQNGIDDREKVYKGIFVGNNAVDEPVDKRPAGFSNSWKRAARRQGIVVMKSVDLYIIHWLRFYGKLSEKDMAEFWCRLFETNGIFDSRAYRKMFQSEKEDS